MKTCNVALTIAGSDSGGNAGIQADIRAFHVFKLHACSVITALTAQNPFEVRSIFTPDAEFVGTQIDTVFDAYSIKALKTGMLCSSEIVSVVSDKLSALKGKTKIVVDPVMVATSGAKLLRDDAIDAVCNRLLHNATIITPNLPETSVILGGEKILSTDEMIEAAKKISDKYNTAVLIKGGHSANSAATDIFYDGSILCKISTDVVENPLSTHGTGCSLSAAITASIANGNDLIHAVVEAKSYLYKAILNGVYVGQNATVMGTPIGIDTNNVTVEFLK